MRDGLAGSVGTVPMPLGLGCSYVACAQVVVLAFPSQLFLRAPLCADGLLLTRTLVTRLWPADARSARRTLDPFLPRA